MRKVTKGYDILLGLVVALALSCASPADPAFCTQPDDPGPAGGCQSAALYSGGVWWVELRRLELTQEPYQDRGYLCSRTVVSCLTTTTCAVTDPAQELTHDQAIQTCRARSG